ncbi:MAG: TonB-dependent receptor [Gammaproteobacteria bacterium]
MRLRDSGLLAMTVVSAVAYVPYVHAQELEEVTVTAQKREQDLQKVTLAVTALTGEDMEKQGMMGFRDWADHVPGITVVQGQDPSRRTGPSATIRGVTQVYRGQLWEVSSGATTSFSVGQVPFMNGDPGLYDLQRIEVLRGPQGTLQGISAMGGAIRFIPNEARADKFAAEVNAGAGAIDQGGNTSDLGFMVNVPLVTDVFAIRLAADKQTNGGFIDFIKPSLSQTAPLDPKDGNIWRETNRINTIDNANKMDKTGARFSFIYTPNDDFTLKGFTNWQRTDYATTTIADLNVPSDHLILDRFSEQPLTEDFTVSSLEASYELGAIGSLQFVGGYYQGRNSETTDNTPQIPTLLAGARPVLDMDGPGGLPPDPFPAASSFPFRTKSNIYTGELRLQGTEKPLFAGMTFDYIAGLYYQDENRGGTFAVSVPDWNLDKGPNTAPILTANGIVLASVGRGHYKNKASFLDLTLNITPKWSVGVGARYYEQDFHSFEWRYGDNYSGRATNGATVGDNLLVQDTPANVGNISENGVTPRATVSYKFDDNKMLYFTAAEGQRLAQGFPNPTGLASNAPQCTPLAQQLGVLDDLQNGTKTDTVWSYDLGLKSKWLDNRLLVNAAVYHLIWSDLQQSIQLVQYDPACNAQIPANVGEVTSDGAELELAYVLNESWHFNSALAYTDARFTSIPSGVGSSLPGVNLKKGDRLRMVSPWTASLGVEYGFQYPQLFGRSFSGYIRADYRYVAERMNNFGDEDLLRADTARSRFFANAYALTDVRLGADEGDLSLSLYISNLFNHLAIYESSQEVFQPNLRSGSVSQPRTIGFTVSKRF